MKRTEWKLRLQDKLKWIESWKSAIDKDDVEMWESHLEAWKVKLKDIQNLLFQYNTISILDIMLEM